MKYVPKICNKYEKTDFAKYFSNPKVKSGKSGSAEFFAISLKYPTFEGIFS